MVQVISKIVTYRHTELTIEKDAHWTIGDAINKQIKDALEKDEQLAEAKVEFTDDEWFAMRRAFHQAQEPNEYERSQGIGATTTNSVPVVAPNASSLPTTNKKEKLSGFGRYYLFTVDSHEHFGPFDSMERAQAWGAKNNKTFQVNRHSELSDYDRTHAIKP